jgi:hypothetical protein
MKVVAAVEIANDLVLGEGAVCRAVERADGHVAVLGIIANTP